MPKTVDNLTELLGRSWTRFPPSAPVTAWIEHVRPVVPQIAEDPQHASWHRYGGTWFVGVNALPNDASGAVNGGPPLAGDAVDFAARMLAPCPVHWDRGQVSICSPGYPQPSEVESAAAHQYRLKRDAAHVDGLLAEGPGRRRFLRQYHQFLLGIPINAVEPGQSPFAVWEGSHHIIRQAFSQVFAGVAAERWHEIDITETYQQARRTIFDTCRRVEICTQAGETYLVHRMALHGIAPWTAAEGPPRAIIYFRPETSDRATWLRKP